MVSIKTFSPCHKFHAWCLQNVQCRLYAWNSQQRERNADNSKVMEWKSHQKENVEKTLNSEKQVENCLVIWYFAANDHRSRKSFSSWFRQGINKPQA